MTYTFYVKVPDEKADLLPVTIGWRSTLNGKEYGDHIRIYGFKEEDLCSAIKLLWRQARGTERLLMEAKRREAE